MSKTSKIWYFAKRDEQRGPYSAATLRKALASGKLKPTTRVWKQGMADWLPAQEVAELAASISASRTPRKIAPGKAAATKKKAGSGKWMLFGCLGLLLMSCCVLSLPKIIFSLFPEMQARIEEEKRKDRKKAVALLEAVARLPSPDVEAAEKPLPKKWKSERPSVLHVDQPFLEQFGRESGIPTSELDWWCRDEAFVDLRDELAETEPPIGWGRAARRIVEADLLAVFHPSYFSWPREGEGDTFYTGVCYGVVVFVEVATGKAVGRVWIDIESSDVVSGGSGIRLAGVPIQTSSFADELYRDFASNIDEGLEAALARLR